MQLLLTRISLERGWEQRTPVHVRSDILISAILSATLSAALEEAAATAAFPPRLAAAAAFFCAAFFLLASETIFDFQTETLRSVEKVDLADAGSDEEETNPDEAWLLGLWFEFERGRWSVRECLVGLIYRERESEGVFGVWEFVGL